MTVEQKLDVLYNAVNKAWENAFDGWEWITDDSNPNKYILGDTTKENGFLFFLAGCLDTYGGWIWIEYEPQNDIVGIYIKNRPIQPELKEDLAILFEKHSPFNMKVMYEDISTPIISRVEKVQPKFLLNYFNEFRNAYDKFYPLFYMFSVSAIKWYDGFYIAGSGC